MAITIQTVNHWPDYELIDSGNFEKLERFGRYVVLRPEPQAIWDKALPEHEWQNLAQARFSRSATDSERGVWQKTSAMPDQWTIRYPLAGKTLTFRLGMTAFKHVGIFPEQAPNWEFIYQQSVSIPRCKVLNLFAYTGGATLAARAAGADVTHVDSVRAVVNWASENQTLSNLDGARWVVEDAMKFVRRQQKKGQVYSGIILDPPAYGRGPDGEKWILEDQLNELMRICGQILDEKKRFLVLNLYSMGFSALVGESLVATHFPGQQVECGELCLIDRAARKLPLSVYVRFYR